MKNNLKIVIISVAIIIIGAAFALGYHYINKPAGANTGQGQTQQTKGNQTPANPAPTDVQPTPADQTAAAGSATFLTKQVVTRLQSYPYFGGTPKYGFKQMIEQRPELAQWAYDTLFGYIIRFHDNEKFYTSQNLTYMTASGHFVVRGVYQVKSKDGTVTQQDVEFEYRQGGNWENGDTLLFYVGERMLSGPKTVGGE